jgi:hypothetical protein
MRICRLQIGNVPNVATGIWVKILIFVEYLIRVRIVARCVAKYATITELRERTRSKTPSQSVRQAAMLIGTNGRRQRPGTVLTKCRLTLGSYMDVQANISGNCSQHIAISSPMDTRLGFKLESDPSEPWQLQLL